MIHPYRFEVISRPDARSEWSSDLVAKTRREAERERQSIIDSEWAWQCPDFEVAVIDYDPASMLDPTMIPAYQ